MLNRNLKSNESTSASSVISSDADASAAQKPVKELRGNEYSLRQLQYKQQRLNNRRQQRKESLKRGRIEDTDTEAGSKKMEEVTTMNSMEAVETWIQENEYKKKWFRLDAYQKRKKLEEYVAAFPKHAEKWTVSLKDLCSKKYNKQIVYDAETCTVKAVNV